MAEPAAAITEDEDEEAVGLPGTDIRIFALSWVEGRPVIGAAMGGVVRPGYDNQPGLSYKSDAADDRRRSRLGGCPNHLQ